MRLLMSPQSFQYPLRVLGCEKSRRRSINAGSCLCFSTLCGFLVVRSSNLLRLRYTHTAFQYPLRVLGCEKVLAF